MVNGSKHSYSAIFQKIKDYSYEKSVIPVQETPGPLLIHLQGSFDGQIYYFEHFVVKNTTRGIECLLVFCAGSSSLQPGVVLVYSLK